MSKFTKGKWKNYINKCVYVLDKKNKFPRFIVFLVCGNTEEEAQANARLIAAAPEMYELLSECADTLNHIGHKVLGNICLELLARIDGEAENE